MAQAQSDTEPTRARLAARVAEASEVCFALLFGSRTAGTARPDSDWDLGVYLADGLAPEQRTALRDRLVAALEPQDRVLIVDDVLATGGTAAAAAELVRDLGATVVGWSFLLELGFLGGKAKLEGGRIRSVVVI